MTSGNPAQKAETFDWHQTQQYNVASCPLYESREIHTASPVSTFTTYTWRISCQTSTRYVPPWLREVLLEGDTTKEELKAMLSVLVSCYLQILLYSMRELQSRELLSNPRRPSICMEKCSLAGDWVTLPSLVNSFQKSLNSLLTS